MSLFKYKRSHKRMTRQITSLANELTELDGEKYKDVSRIKRLNKVLKSLQEAKENCSKKIKTLTNKNQKSMVKI